MFISLGLCVKLDRIQKTLLHLSSKMPGPAFPCLSVFCVSRPKPIPVVHTNKYHCMTICFSLSAWVRKCYSQMNLDNFHDEHEYPLPKKKKKRFCWINPISYEKHMHIFENMCHYNLKYINTFDVCTAGEISIERVKKNSIKYISY